MEDLRGFSNTCENSWKKPQGNKIFAHPQNMSYLLDDFNR